MDTCSAFSVNFSVGPVYAMPLGGFSSGVGQSFVGAGFDYWFTRVDSGPWRIGISNQLFVYGQKNFSNLDRSVSVVSNHDLFQAALVARYTQGGSDFNTFLDVFLGLNLFFTEVQQQNRGSASVNDVISSVATDPSFAPMLGIGVGVQRLFFNRSYGGGDCHGLCAYFEARVRFLWGGSATYYVPRFVNVDHGVVSVSSVTTQTYMTHFSLSLNFLL